MTRIIHGVAHVKVPVEVQIPLSKNDIFNWLTDCTDPDTLRYLGSYAINCARGLEQSDNDDFRSRA